MINNIRDLVWYLTLNNMSIKAFEVKGKLINPFGIFYVLYIWMFHRRIKNRVRELILLTIYGSIIDYDNYTQ